MSKDHDESSHKVSEAAQEFVREALPAIQEHAKALSKEASAAARKFAADQGPTLREASRRAVEEFKKALDEANQKQS
jgi:hypothetical protein